MLTTAIDENGAFTNSSLGGGAFSGSSGDTGQK